MKRSVSQLVALLCAVCLIGCTVHAEHGTPADAMNRKAQAWQYRNTDSAAHYAHQALDNTTHTAHDTHTKNVARNTLGFVANMHMHYDEALTWYAEAYKRTGCELERLVADVGCMEVYQRMADNRAFYECRTRAMKRVAHINEEVAHFSDAEYNRLQATLRHLHLLTAYHHYMMGQRPEAYDEMALLPGEETLRTDTVRWLMYQYLKGIGLDGEEYTPEQRMIQRYTHLTNCMRTAKAAGYEFFEGMAAVGMAQLLADSARTAYIARMRPNSLAQLDTTATDAASLSMALAERAITTLAEYGDAYGMLAATIQRASLHNRQGAFREALEPLTQQQPWDKAPDVQARMYEEASLAYSGLADKEASDEYRNLYLDLLETTRQDKELESRYRSLAQQRRTMDILLYVTLVGIALFVVLVVLQARRRKRGGGRYEQKLYELAQEAGKRVYLHRKHIEQGKRDNIVRKASFSVVTGIMPYIDRMAHEVERLQMPEVWNDEQLRTRKLEYITELTGEINALNEVLTQWISTKQGMVKLHIESFALAEVMAMIERAATSFALKGITLTVQPTDAVVKADKALTFFMLNTLADNARKFTPDGGSVSIAAEVHDEYIEISVTDNGPGMSADEVDRILNSKVYDAAAIGQGLTPEQRKTKGSGFGLLNCKGIIEKYRKTDALFEVCRFGIDSCQHEGSRFWFRLPKSMRRMLMALTLIVSGTTLCRAGEVETPATYASAGYDTLLVQASAFADSVYYANVEGRYTEALRYADSAIAYLNTHHRTYATNYIGELSATGAEADVETLWWLSDYATDYHTILDVRNELAVANLALQRWQDYRYNNRIYNDLYKLVSEDRSLIDYCNRMQRYNSNTFVAVLICVLLALAYLTLIICAFMGRVESAYRDIETVEEDERRARHEENRLHVQNMVIDNCLSTIKHETVYYPNRIRQLVARLDQHDERQQIQELVDYYKTIFSTLSACAARQLEEVTFRRSAVEVNTLFDEAVDYHAKQRKLHPEAPALEVESSHLWVACDPHLIAFLLEQLINASLAHAAGDRLSLKACMADASELTHGGKPFVSIIFTNHSRKLEREALHQLFAPSPSRMAQTPDGKYRGMEYIVARQIIREHDSYFGHIGCRIMAEPTDTGYAVWFSIPAETVKNL